jgi:hypothetical protein
LKTAAPRRPGTQSEERRAVTITPLTYQQIEEIKKDDNNYEDKIKVEWKEQIQAALRDLRQLRRGRRKAGTYHGEHDNETMWERIAIHHVWALNKKVFNVYDSDGRADVITRQERDHRLEMGLLFTHQHSGLGKIYVTPELKANILQKSVQGTILAQIRTHPLSFNILNAASYSFMGHDRLFMEKVVKINGMALQYASDDLKEDRELVLAAVQQNGLALEFASYPHKSDINVMWAAINNDKRAIDYASADLQAKFRGKGNPRDLENDRRVWINKLGEQKDNFWVLREAPKDLMNDEEFMLDAIKINWMSISYASDILTTNVDFMIKAQAVAYGQDDEDVYSAIPDPLLYRDLTEPGWRDLDKLAHDLEHERRLDEAEEMFRRALAIKEASARTGPPEPGPDGRGLGDVPPRIWSNSMKNN